MDDFQQSMESTIKIGKNTFSERETCEIMEEQICIKRVRHVPVIVSRKSQMAQIISKEKDPIERYESRNSDEDPPKRSCIVYAGKRHCEEIRLETTAGLRSEDGRDDIECFCSFCRKSLPMKDSLTRRVQIFPGKFKHYSVCMKCFSLELEPPYECNECGSFFPKKDLLDNHLITHLEKHECGVCDKVFPNNQILLDHLRYHVDPHECVTCDEVFSSKREYNDHVRTHVGSRECVTCDEVFQNKVEYNDHLRTHLNSIMCKVCNKTFANKQDLYGHLKIHSESRMRNRHHEEYQHSQDHFQQHARKYQTLTPDQRYKCSEYDRIMSSKWHLYHHQAVNRDLSCWRGCRQRFPEGDAVPAHAHVRKTEPRTERAHSKTRSAHRRTTSSHARRCLQCGKYFPSKSTSYEHKKTRVGVKVFSCSICQAQFSANQELVNHMQMHMGKNTLY